MVYIYIFWCQKKSRNHFNREHICVIFRLLGVFIQIMTRYDIWWWRFLVKKIITYCQNPGSFKKVLIILQPTVMRRNLYAITNLKISLFQMTITVRPMKEHLKSKRKRVSSRKPMLQYLLLRILLILPTSIRIPDYPDPEIQLSTTTYPRSPPIRIWIQT